MANELHQHQDSTAWESAIDASGDRSRFMLQIYMAVFVLVCSFCYGFVRGLSKHGPTANAAAARLGAIAPMLHHMKHLSLPDGVEAVPIGRNARINEHEVEAMSFVSNRPVADITREVIGDWQAKGIRPTERLSDRRAVVIGVEPETGTKYSLMVWQVPPPLRAAVSQGYAVQGTIAASAHEPRRSTAASQAGEVPGVPVMPGGSGGAVFSSDDAGGRSYTSIYTHPGSPEDSIWYYRGEMRQRGWRELGPRAAVPQFDHIGQQHFTKGKRKLSLLYSLPPKASLPTDELKTVVTVVSRADMPRVSGRSADF